MSTINESANPFSMITPAQRSSKISQYQVIPFSSILLDNQKINAYFENSLSEKKKYYRQENDMSQCNYEPVSNSQINRHYLMKNRPNAFSFK